MTNLYDALRIKKVAPVDRHTVLTLQKDTLFSVAKRYLLIYTGYVIYSDVDLSLTWALGQTDRNGVRVCLEILPIKNFYLQLISWFT